MILFVAETIEPTQASTAHAPQKRNESVTRKTHALGVAREYAVTVQVEVVYPVDGSSEPCLEPTTVGWLDEIARRAEQGDWRTCSVRAECFASCRLSAQLDVESVDLFSLRNDAILKLREADELIGTEGKDGKK